MGKIRHFSKYINEYHDGIASFPAEKGCDKIHAQRGPGVSWLLERLVKSCWLSTRRFNPGAGEAASQKPFDLCYRFRPQEILKYQVQ